MSLGCNLTGALTADITVNNGAAIAAGTSLRLVMNGLHNPDRRVLASGLRLASSMPITDAEGVEVYYGVLESDAFGTPPVAPFQILSFWHVAAVLEHAYACTESTLLIGFNTSKPLHRYDAIGPFACFRPRPLPLPAIDAQPSSRPPSPPPTLATTHPRHQPRRLPPSPPTLRPCSLVRRPSPSSLRAPPA